MMKGQIENTLGITNQDVFQNVIQMASTIGLMKKSMDKLESIMKEKREFNEDEYTSFVDLFSLEGSERLTQEEFNEFVKTDRNKINNHIVLAKKEIKEETKRYIAVLEDVEKNLPDVYKALQEFTKQVLASNK